MNKGNIVDKYLAQKQRTINDLESNVNRLNSDADIDEDATKDPEDFSQQDQSREMERHLQVQLATAKAEYEFIKAIKEQELASVETGALVQSGPNFFLIGPAMRNFNEGLHNFYGVSSDSPMFKSIQGKTKGDKFLLGDDEYTIDDIM